MKNRFITAGLLIILAAGCRTDAGNLALIDYGDMQEIGIEVVVETGEQDEYVSGRIRDLVLTSDGGILVSDQQTNTIEQFDSNGRHIATIARKGNGPGELPSFATFIAGAQHDTLIARYGSTGRHDYFIAGNDRVFRYARSTVPQEAGSSNLTVQGRYSTTKYYATRSFLTMNNIEEPTRKVSVVVIDSLEQIVQDSLHVLKMSNPYARASPRSLEIFGMPPFQFNDRIRVMENGHYLIARPDSAALFFYNHRHELIKKVALKIKPRSVHKAEVDYALDDKTPEIRSEMAARVREVKPPFLNIWAGRSRLWLLTDENEEGKQLVILTMDGEPLGQLRLPTVDDVMRIKNNRIYTIHRSPDAGERIRIYEVNFETEKPSGFHLLSPKPPKIDITLQAVYEVRSPKPAQGGTNY